MSQLARVEKMDCMTKEEWEEWLEAARNYQANANRSRNYKTLRVRPCHDCTRAFAAEMQAQDRCNGVPGAWRDMTRAEHRRYNMLLSQRRRRAVA